CLPLPVITSTLGGNGAFASSSFRRLASPASPSTSKTQKPEGIPVAQPMLSAGFAPHHVSMCFKFVVASLKPLRLTGVLSRGCNGKMAQPRLASSRAALCNCVITLYPSGKERPGKKCPGLFLGQPQMLHLKNGGCCHSTRRQPQPSVHPDFQPAAAERGRFPFAGPSQ